jgi:Pyruvate/2-oxoacid:ferredoxin oxidoreductase gamma subunit
MEREIILTGVGGQGVQLGGQILARAATLEKREVMYLGTYGGTMRGGSTDTTIVVADGPIESPPIVSRIDSGLAMHHAFWKPVAAKLRPGALVIVNSTVFDAGFEHGDARVFEVPATRLASELGNSLGASLVLVAAYANLTGLVSVESLVEAMRQSVPAYRRQHLEANERTLREGYLALPGGVAPTWGDAPVEGGAR